jgi:hypothetical protein
MNTQMIAATLSAETKAGGVADPRKRRQIESAWRRHDPAQGRVPFEAKRRLYTFKRALTASAARIERHLSPHDPLLAACIRRRGLPRQRALTALRMTLRDAVISGSKDCVEVRWLAPREHLIVDTEHPGECQDSVCVHVALLPPTCWNVPITPAPAF